MRILVTGGGGFLGGGIVRLLLRRGDAVRVLGRSRYPALERLGVECIAGDLRDAAAVAAACRCCDAVFHVAAKAGVWGAAVEFAAVNIDGTRTVVEACLREGVSRLVHTSSPSVVFGREPIEGGDESLPYPERWLAPYPATKAAAERLVLGANGAELATSAAGRLRTCAIRPHLIWGPGDPHIAPRLVKLARAGRLRQIGAGTNRVDITHVDHAAAAHVQALDALAAADSPVAGNAYFIGDREPVVLWDWIRDLLGQLALTLPARAVPFRVAYLAGGALEGLYRLLPMLGEPPMTRFVAAQFAMSHWFSHARAARDFGYNPWRDPADSLRELAASLRSAPSAG